MQHSSDSTCSPPGKQTNKPLAPQQHFTPPHPEHRCSATPQGPPTKHRMAFKSTAGVSAGSPTAAAHIACSGYGARNVPYVSKQLQQTCWPQKSLQIVHARCTRHLCCKLRHNTRLHTTCTAQLIQIVHARCSRHLRCKHGRSKACLTQHTSCTSTRCNAFPAQSGTGKPSDNMTRWSQCASRMLADALYSRQQKPPVHCTTPTICDMLLTYKCAM